MLNVVVKLILPVVLTSFIVATRKQNHVSGSQHISIGHCWSILLRDQHEVSVLPLNVVQSIKRVTSPHIYQLGV